MNLFLFIVNILLEVEISFYLFYNNYNYSNAKFVILNTNIKYL